MLQKHFALYGKIEFIDLHEKPTHRYSYIQYTSVHSAAAVLHHRHHFVRGFRIKVSVAYSHHQPITSIDDISAQISSLAKSETKNENDDTHFLELNDDCLYHIFGFFNCIDMSAVHQTCKRFQRVAEYLIRAKREAINLTMTKLPDYNNIAATQLTKFTLFQIRNLFVVYGENLRKLRISAFLINETERNQALECIFAKYTSPKSLVLNGFHLVVCRQMIGVTYQKLLFTKFYLCLLFFMFL